VTVHWEHGYRTHGLWDERGRRLGAVSLGPRDHWDGVYRYWTDAKPDAVGEAATLRAAKRAVERAIREAAERWGK
jgi:hypothetical protein